MATKTESLNASSCFHCTESWTSQTEELLSLQLYQNSVGCIHGAKIDNAENRFPLFTIWTSIRTFKEVLEEKEQKMRGWNPVHDWSKRLFITGRGGFNQSKP
ncbi:hypothetical protein AMECASPLE_019919 [Ameca splendens]|uniref:Uncharacterized protein n=1 Tax=Ameca splendens TaxID=208324 RepID=A0ABV0XS38_9TELE